jgi:hypothetical protein
VHILGHTGQILGSYLHDIFQPRHSSFVAMTQLENHMSQPCLTVSILKIFELFNLDWYKLPFDGSNDAFEIFFRLLCSIINEKTLSGARPALPMGVAPKAIVEKTFFKYRLQYIVPTFTHQIAALFDNIVGCALNAPDGSSPRGYSQIFLGIDSKNEFFFLDSSVSFTSVFRRLSWSSLIRRSVIPYFCWIFPY